MAVVSPGLSRRVRYQRLEHDLEILATALCRRLSEFLWDQSEPSPRP